MTYPPHTGTRNTIVDLMRVPPADYNLKWLKNPLQAAVQLEMATIPPYLCAMWSIKDPADPVRAIRDIVLEEMSHMGTACNVLTAIGGTPRLNTADVVPTYPGPLPGGVHTDLIVSLSGLARRPRMERERLRLLPWASHPTVTHDARQGGDDPFRHWTELHPQQSSLQSV